MLSVVKVQERTFLRQQTNGALDSNVLVVASTQNPLDDADIVAKAGPHELAALLTEPVHVEDLRHLQVYNIDIGTSCAK